jgi:hypothetical protein
LLSGLNSRLGRRSVVASAAYLFDSMPFTTTFTAIWKLVSPG